MNSLLEALPASLRQLLWWGGGLALLIVLSLGVALSSLIGAALLACLAAALLFLTAFYRPDWLILFLAAFMPFESFLLKFIPGSDQVQLIASFASELIIYLTLAVVLLRRLVSKKSFKRTPLDIPLFCFALAAFTSLLLYDLQADTWFGATVNIRAVLRYIALFYIVVNIRLTGKQISGLFNLILIIAGINLIIGFAQRFIGEPFYSFFAPDAINADIAGQSRGFILVRRGREIGAIYGALSDTLFFGLFLVISWIVYLSRAKRITLGIIAAFIIVVTAVGFSYSRIALLTIPLVAFIFYYWRYGTARTVLLSVIGITVLAWAAIFLIEPSENFVNARHEQRSVIEDLAGVFTIDYLTTALYHQRLGHLIGTIPTILMNRPILGYGPNQEATVEQLNNSSPSFLYFGLNAKGFEDVYWMALLAYYGLIGTAAIIAVLVITYRKARALFQASIDAVQQSVALVAMALVVVTTLLLFLNQVLEFRVYGFYFWLLVGLMFNQYGNSRYQRKRFR